MGISGSDRSRSHRPDRRTRRLKCAGLDADGEDVTASPTRALTALAALAALAAGCGSSSTTPASQPAPKVSATQLAQDEVTKMVLGTGDLPGYSLNSTGGEKLQDQLPPKRTPGYAAMVRTVKSNWLASEHSVVVSQDGRVLLFSDANLFRSESAMREVWKLERKPIPGIHTKDYRPSPGAPAGSRLVWTDDGKKAGFELTWPQGQVIGLTLIFGHPGEKFTPLNIRRISSFLSAAAKAQARLIANAEAAGLGSAA